MAVITLKDIEITLDPKSIDRALKEVKTLDRNTKEMTNAMCNYLLDEGVKIAQNELKSYKMAGGPLYNSVRRMRFVKTKGEGYIRAGEGLKSGAPGTSYAMFVEYGFPKSGGENKGAPALVYRPKLNLPGGAKQPEPVAPTKKKWRYKHKNGHFYTSYGQPPKPFMRNTMNRLWQLAELKTREFRRYLWRE